MAVPIVYRKSAETSIASYNYTDIANGAGYVIYYGGAVVSGSTLSYRLSSESFYSNKIMTMANTTSAAFTKTHDCDFDIQFKIPRVIKGDVIANIPMDLYPLGNGASVYVYPHVRIRKWDGTTETELANTSGAVLIYSPTVINTHFSGMAGVIIPVTQALFKKNETLRCTVELWTKSDGATTLYSLLGHDPKNRATNGYDQQENTLETFGSNPSNLIIQVPFKIDL